LVPLSQRQAAPAGTKGYVCARKPHTKPRRHSAVQTLQSSPMRRTETATTKPGEFSAAGGRGGPAFDCRIRLELRISYPQINGPAPAFATGFSPNPPPVRILPEPPSRKSSGYLVRGSLPVPLPLILGPPRQSGAKPAACAPPSGAGQGHESVSKMHHRRPAAAIHARSAGSLRWGKCHSRPALG